MTKSSQLAAVGFAVLLRVLDDLLSGLPADDLRDALLRGVEDGDLSVRRGLPEEWDADSRPVYLLSTADGAPLGSFRTDHWATSYVAEVR